MPIQECSLYLTHINMSRLVNIFTLAEVTGVGVRTLRTWMAERKIPFYRCGHRTVFFDPRKVDEALERFEVRAISSNERRGAGRASNGRNTYRASQQAGWLKKKSRKYQLITDP